MDNNGSLQVVDLWYDWTNGRNFNIIQNQLGKLLYDLEWDNGTSYIYTLDSNKECRVLHFPVGVLRPNWLEGATYLGQQEVDGFLCNVWQKVDFIWYYEDVITKRPVYWVFYTGMTAHVMTFEVGAVLEDPKWQAPVYCFKESEKKENTVFKSVVSHGLSREDTDEKHKILHNDCCSAFCLLKRFTVYLLLYMKRLRIDHRVFLEASTPLVK